MTRIGLALLGAVLLAGALILACAREAPDRASTIQGPLFLLIIAAPALSYMLRRRARALRVLTFVAQLTIYFDEAGISSATNIRIDALPILAAILLNAWLVVRGLDLTAL
jgi:hypothetical protein